ncbi:MAG: ROK family protein [Propionibacteriaceae bacterium]|jgi:polyphosphate glucokinase|nr:ROK family protein [Propionibacteriaceae bacterium]
MTAHAFGVDIGGSGVKGAPVDVSTGELVGERVRIPTPQPATPRAVAKVVGQIIEQVAERTGDDAIENLAEMPVGITVPAIVSHGVTRSAANIDKKWIDAPAEEIFADVLGRPVTILNDADAAGYAEVYYGAAQGESGLVIVTTLGTGIGSALVYHGQLIPNIELGHLEIDGFDAEKRAAASVRTKEDLSWKAYTKRLQRFYSKVEFLFSPDLFVVGGGISRHSDKFLPQLDLRARIVPAQLFNQAGIVGAARFAHDAPAG